MEDQLTCLDLPEHGCCWHPNIWPRPQRHMTRNTAKAKAAAALQLRRLMRLPDERRLLIIKASSVEAVDHDLSNTCKTDLLRRMPRLHNGCRSPIRIARVGHMSFTSHHGI